MPFIYYSTCSLIISKQFQLLLLLSDLLFLGDLSQSTVFGCTVSLPVPKGNLKRRYAQEKSTTEGAEQTDPYCHHKPSFCQAYTPQDRYVRDVTNRDTDLFPHPLLTPASLLQCWECLHSQHSDVSSLLSQTPHDKYMSAKRSVALSIHEKLHYWWIKAIISKAQKVFNKYICVP